MSIAFVFPGQGAQTIGMGRDLAEAYPEARAVFQEVDDALGEKLELHWIFNTFTQLLQKSLTFQQFLWTPFSGDHPHR